MSALNVADVAKQLAGAIAETEANIDNISVEEHIGSHNTISLTLSVRHRVHLARIFRRIRTLPVVTRMSRVKL